jgi:hypothetical protein
MWEDELGLVERTGRNGDLCRILVGKPEGKRPFRGATLMSGYN